MKKILYGIMALGLAAGISLGAMQTLNDQDATKVGLPSLVTKVNANFSELYAQPSLTNVIVTGDAIVGDDLVVTGAVTVGETLQATGNTVLKGNLNVAGTLVSTGAITGPISAANLTAGTAASAINGAAITNLTGTASVNGTTLNALNLANCTNLPSGGVVSLDSAKLTGNIAVARLTNAVGVTAATITITNYGVGNIYGTNVITFFGTVSYP